ncbi:YdcF family protein [Candidatus Saccharibacteria bacterium]|nr:YdcF family protein [Candidatus Saccharibacteria bacterium]
MILGLLIGFFVMVAGIDIYLSPDDLSACRAADGPTSEMNCIQADAIIAVSGGDTDARTDEAIGLYRAGWAETLIFSGAARDTTGPSNAEVMRSRAIAAGVPAGSIEVEEFSRTTRENAQNTTSILTRRNIQSVIVVTSEYHQRRTSLEMQRWFGEAINVRSHPVAQDNQWDGLWWTRFSGWQLAVAELIKIGEIYAQQR